MVVQVGLSVDFKEERKVEAVSRLVPETGELYTDAGLGTAGVMRGMLVWSL
jgi:hypothetical protein